MFDKILQSSKNPEKVSLTINGILMQGISLAVLLGGSTMDGALLGDLADVITGVIAAGLSLIGLLQIGW